MTTVALSTSMGAGAVTGSVRGVTTCETRREHVPVTEGPVDIRTVALDAGMAGGWTVVSRGYDNLAANPTMVQKRML